MRLNSLLLSAMICLTGVTALQAQQTRIITPDKYSDYGLSYTLPLTAIEVEVTATHTVRQAGPFRQYAPKYTGIRDAIMKDSESWDIIAVKLRPYGIANDSAIYRMQLKAGQPLELCVAQNGMLLGINTIAEAPPAWAPIQPQQPLSILSATEFLQYVPEDYASAQSDARRAALLAQGLNDVRQARLELTRGTADNMPTDGRQLELMLNSLAHQEEAMMAAFRGREVSETRSARFSLIPEGEGRYVIGRINAALGFVNHNDLSGIPIYIDIKQLEAPEVPKDAGGNELKMPRDGIIYCLPGTASVKISWQGRELYSETMEMSQLGTTFALNPALFTNKKNPAYAIFDSSTGALLRLGEKQP